MKGKIFSLFLLCFVLTGPVSAQSSAVEAKAAYLLAEESYGKGEMRTALQYLEDATSKLGTANAKVLYLKIMTLKELAVTDTGFNSKLDKAIAEFEKAPDAESFNEEKVLEIVKIKLQRKRQLSAASENQKVIEAFEQRTHFPVGASFDSIYLANKERLDAYFKRSYTSKERMGTDGFAIFMEENKVTEAIYLSGSRIKSYVKFHFSYGDENSSFSKSNAEFPAVLRTYTDLFGSTPVEQSKTTQSVTAGQTYTTVTRQYAWRAGSKALILYLLQITGPDYHASSCNITLTNDPKTISEIR